MRISEMFVSLGLVSILFVALGSTIASLGSNYGKTDSFNYQSYNQMDDINQHAQELQSKLSTQKGFNPLVVFSVLNFLFFDIAGVLFNVPNMIIDIISGFEANSGIVGISYVFVGITAVVLIVVVLKIASIVTSKEI